MNIYVPFPPLPPGPHTMEQARAFCEARERQLKAAGLVQAPNGEWVTPEALANQGQE